MYIQNVLLGWLGCFFLHITISNDSFPRTLTASDSLELPHKWSDLAGFTGFPSLDLMNWQMVPGETDTV